MCSVECSQRSDLLFQVTFHYFANSYVEFEYQLRNVAILFHCCLNTYACLSYFILDYFIMPEYEDLDFYIRPHIVILDSVDWGQRSGLFLMIRPFHKIWMTKTIENTVVREGSRRLKIPIHRRHILTDNSVFTFEIYQTVVSLYNIARLLL